MGRLIGLVGFAGSGKSSVAKELVYMGYAPVKFAKPLKDMLRAIGLTDREIEGDLKEQPCAKLCGKTPRFAMVTLGTEWGRDMIGEDFWLNLFKYDAGEYLRAGFNVVCDDVRFPNEVETVRRLGGVIVRVERPGIEVDTGHRSEQHVEDMDVDHFILNDGTLDSLHHRVLALLKEIA